MLLTLVSSLGEIGVGNGLKKPCVIKKATLNSQVQQVSHVDEKTDSFTMINNSQLLIILH